MTPYGLERIEMPEIGVLRYNITGLETNAETEPGLVNICRRLEAEPQWTGVLFDHSQSQISYTLAEFSERVDYAIKHFPRRVKIAYVFNPQTFVVSRGRPSCSRAPAYRRKLPERQGCAGLSRVDGKLGQTGLTALVVAMDAL